MWFARYYFNFSSNIGKSSSPIFTFILTITILLTNVLQALAQAEYLITTFPQLKDDIKIVQFDPLGTNIMCASNHEIVIFSQDGVRLFEKQFEERPKDYDTYRTYIEKIIDAAFHGSLIFYAWEGIRNVNDIKTFGVSSQEFSRDKSIHHLLFDYFDISKQVDRLYGINCLAVNASQKLAAIAVTRKIGFAKYFGSVLVYDLKTGRLINQYDEVFAGAKALRFSEDGALLAVGSKYEAVQIMKATQKQYGWWSKGDKHSSGLSSAQGHQKGVNQVVFTADGKMVVSSSDDKTIKIWGTYSGNLIKTISLATITGGDVQALDVSPDGRYIVSGGSDKTVRIWDIKTGSQIRALASHKGRINSVAVSANGRLIASGSDDKTVRLWNLEKVISDLESEQKLIATQKEEQERRRRATPCKLTVSPSYDDSQAFLPNQVIDGGEAAYLQISISNEGPGPAFAVSTTLTSDNPQIMMNDTRTEIFPEIPPNQVKGLRIPISAGLSVVDGNVTITIHAKESRGYDARPIQLQIPVRHLDKPALSFTSFTLNDGTSGLASGNGNGLAENGETVEVTAFVKNSGVGASLYTTLNLQTASTGAEIRQSAVRLGTIAQGETKQGKVVIAIPRTFSGKELRLTFAARDTIGASQITKEHVLPMSTRSPVIAFDSRFLDSRGVQVDEVNNGGNYVLEIVPRNEGQIGARVVQTNVSVSTAVNLPNVSTTIGDLAAGAAAAPVRFNFSLPRNYNAGAPQFSLRLSQADFPDISQQLSIPFRRKVPNLVVREVVNTTDGNADILQGENVDIDLVIDNQGDLDAENVEVSLDFTHTGINFPERSKSLGRITAGGRATHRFSFLVKTGAAVGPLAGKLSVRQADGFPGIDKPLNYSISALGAQIVTVTPTVQPGAVQPVAPVARANAPPVVFLSLKNLPVEGKSYDPFVTLEIQIQDDKPMLGVEPEIRVNGKPQPKEMGLRGLGLQDREAKEVDRKIRLFRRVELSEGLNDIEVRVYDSDNEIGLESTQVEYLASRTDIWALVVGVSDYSFNGITDLAFAAADAQAFGDFLRSPEGGSVQPDHLKLLLNSSATRENILRDFETVTSRAGDNDLVLIYLAMHGDVDAGELYFLAHNTDPRNLLATAIKKSEIEGVLQRRVRSQKIVWFADACHSGATGGDPQVAMRATRASATNKLLREMAKARNGLAFFMSARGAEFSQEGSKWGGGHGVFTHFLLKGLRGEADRNMDNFVSLLELYDYVSKQVSEATDGRQNPLLEGVEYDRNLPLSSMK